MKRKISLLAISTIFLFIILGCERKANISSPKLYNKDGITFLYPKNWTVSKANIKQNFKNITILSPGAALFTIQVYSKSDAMSLREYAELFSSEIRKNISLSTMQQSSFSNIIQTENSRDISGIREDSTATLIGVKTPFIREYYMIKLKNKVSYLMTHTPTKHLIKVKPGFDLILKSFKLK